jgi:hypothetical protein
MCPVIGHAQSTLQQSLGTGQMPKVSGSFNLGYSSNLYERSDYAFNSTTDASVILNYNAGSGNLVRGVFSGFQENDHGRETKLNDGFVGWVNNGFWKKGEILTIGQQIRLNMPTSKDSRVRDTKVLGVSLVPVFIANMTPVGITGLTLIYQPQLIKNFHTYKVNRAETSNTSYAAVNTFIASYSFMDKFYIQPVLAYSMGWTYNNRKKDDSYSASAELGYSVLNNLTIAGGWSNTAAIRNLENGNDQTINVFNKKTSLVYGALYYMF